MPVTSIDADNRVRLPAEWMRELGLHGLVVLERTSEGILVRPYPRASWADIFATKLVVGSAPPEQQADTSEATGDDFLF
jgi:DNA-binding transcriptional regulator/RsmH inhibitor MraZ